MADGAVGFRLPTRTRGMAAATARTARRAPLTVGVVAVAWLLGLITGSALGGPSPALLTAVGTGIVPISAGRWWTPLTAMVIWGGPTGYLATTAVLLVGGALAERRLGRLRAAALLVGTQLVGTVTALGLVAGGTALGGEWAADLAGQVVVGAGPGAVGLILAASNALSALWRRRLRLLLVVGAVMLVGYSGELFDVLLLHAALLGLAAGRLVVPRPGPRYPALPTRPETRVLVAMLVAASAIGPVVAALARAPIGPLSVLQFVVLSPPPDADTVQQICATAPAVACRAFQARLRLSGIGPALGSTVPVLLLLVTAEGLRRGRRAARVVGLGLNVLLALLGVVLAIEVGSTPDVQLVVYGGAPGARQVLELVLPPLLPLAVAVLLARTRDQFTVRAPSGTYRRLLRIVGSVLVAVSVLYVFGGWLVANQFDRPPTIGSLAADLPLRFLPPGYLGEVEPDFLPEGYLATLLFEWSGVVFWLVVAVGLLVTFVQPRFEAGDADVARARTLLVERGGSNLGWLTTWPGQSYWFTPEADAAIAYRVHGSIAITTADPLGHPADRPAAVAGFAGFCRDRGWTPALYSVTESTMTAARQLGWKELQVAEETVLNLPELEFTGKKWQDVRTALNKAAREGIVAEWISYPGAPLAITDQIRAISEEWVADRGMPEMGFTLGGLDELADEAVRCLIAVDGERSVHGITSWLPVYRDGALIGWTLDFMRRRGTGFRGVMEFLIASAALDLKAEGCELVSLSGAPLAQFDRGEDPRGLRRVLETIGHALEPVYGFRSLLAFKAKFQPRYEPLYLVYPDPVALPAIGIALARAYLPGLTTRQSAALLARMRA